MSSETEIIEKPDMVAIAKLGEKQKLDAQGVLDLIKAHEINSNDDFATAVGMVAKVKGTFTERDGGRKEVVAPLNDEVKAVNDELKPGLDFLAEAEAILKTKLGAFAKTQFRQRTKLLAEAAEAVAAQNQEKADELITQADEYQPPKVPGCAVGEDWKGEVTNADEIPKEYLTPDLKALKAFTKAKKVDPKIPGWKAWPEPTVTITVSKVKV